MKQLQRIIAIAIAIAGLSSAHALQAVPSDPNLETAQASSGTGQATEAARETAARVDPSSDVFPTAAARMSSVSFCRQLCEIAWNRCLRRCDPEDLACLIDCDDTYIACFVAC